MAVPNNSKLPWIKFPCLFQGHVEWQYRISSILTRIKFPCLFQGHVEWQYLISSILFWIKIHVCFRAMLSGSTI